MGWRPELPPGTVQAAQATGRQHCSMHLFCRLATSPPSCHAFQAIDASSSLTWAIGSTHSLWHLLFI